MARQYLTALGDPSKRGNICSALENDVAQDAVMRLLQGLVLGGPAVAHVQDASPLLTVISRAGDVGGVTSVPSGTVKGRGLDGGGADELHGSHALRATGGATGGASSSFSSSFSSSSSSSFPSSPCGLMKQYFFPHLHDSGDDGGGWGGYGGGHGGGHGGSGGHGGGGRWGGHGGWGMGGSKSAAPNTSASSQSTSSSKSSAKTETLGRPRACFVAHVTTVDRDMAPGERFVKKWRVMNEGHTRWPKGCSLEHVGGDRLTTAKVMRCPMPEVLPGQCVDVSIDLVAPLRPGRHVAYYRLRDHEGTSALEVER